MTKLANIIVMAAASVSMLALSSVALADDARKARLRLLCAQISGDLTDPGGLAQFRRCLSARDPVVAMRQNAVPARRPMPQLVAKRGVALTGAVSGAGACKQGLVWREATASDHTCVTPAIRAKFRGTGRTN